MCSSSPGWSTGGPARLQRDLGVVHKSTQNLWCVHMTSGLARRGGIPARRARKSTYKQTSPGQSCIIMVSTLRSYYKIGTFTF